MNAANTTRRQRAAHRPASVPSGSCIACETIPTERPSGLCDVCNGAREFYEEPSRHNPTGVRDCPKCG
jgi:hypothetical protein